MMPRTTNLPSDLIDTQARSLARTVTSKDCAPAAFALPADEAGLATSGALDLVTAEDGIACLLAMESAFLATGAFKSTEGVVAGPACNPVFGVAAGVSVFVASASDGVEVCAAVAGLVAAGVAALAGIVTVPEPVA